MQILRGIHSDRTAKALADMDPVENMLNTFALPPQKLYIYICIYITHNTLGTLKSILVLRLKSPNQL